jgi:hypothetical protein
MPERILTKFGPADIPSVEELRALGRERLLNYFLFTDEKPPDDLDALARAANRLLREEAINDPFDWEAALKNEKWIPIEDVARELGVDLDEGSPDESAA